MERRRNNSWGVSAPMNVPVVTEQNKDEVYITAAQNPVASLLTRLPIM